MSGIMFHDRPRVFGVGELLWDLLPQGKQLGGAPGNVMYFAGALGADATLISRVGSDPLGDEALMQLTQLNVDTRAISRDPQHRTGTASIDLDQKRNAKFVIQQPVAWDFIPADPQLVREVEQADAICFGTLAQRMPTSRHSIRQLVESTSRSALRILDINLRPPFCEPEVIHDSLTMANVLKINHEELATIAELLELAGSEIDCAREVLNQFELRLVAVTKGAEGSLLVTNDRVSTHPGIRPQVIRDTIGAGDAFTAALIIGLLRNHDLDALHDRAARLASYVCSQSGATPPLPESL
jgi:fructokinase